MQVDVANIYETYKAMYKSQNASTGASASASNSAVTSAPNVNANGPGSAEAQGPPKAKRLRLPDEARQILIGTQSPISPHAEVNPD